MSWSVVPALAAFAMLSVVLVLVDVRIHCLPDAILLPGGGVVLVLLAGAAASESHLERLSAIAGGAVAAFFVCLTVHLARPAAFGGGDVKLAGLCGAVLGWAGPDAVASGIALGFIAGGAGAAGVVLAGARGATIAFGPFLLLGTWGRLAAGPW